MNGVNWTVQSSKSSEPHTGRVCRFKKATAKVVEAQEPVVLTAPQRRIASLNEQSKMRAKANWIKALSASGELQLPTNTETTTDPERQC